MLRASKHSFWLVPAVTLLGMGITAKVNAQTVYPFNTSYDTEVTLIPIPSTDVLQAFISALIPMLPMV
jgi:hypothetical protein